MVMFTGPDVVVEYAHLHRGHSERLGKLEGHTRHLFSIICQSLTGLRHQNQPAEIQNFHGIYQRFLFNFCAAQFHHIKKYTF